MISYFSNYFYRYYCQNNQDGVEQMHSSNVIGSTPALLV